MQGKTLFRAYVGDSPTARIIEFLIEGDGLDYSMADMASNINVSWRTVHRLIPELEKIGLVIHTRRIGKAKLYSLNKENIVVKKLVELFNAVIRRGVMEQALARSYVRA
ncbi:MAG: HTH domain-containing protein [Candidatus Woesearchaeota archaeon]